MSEIGIKRIATLSANQSTDDFTVLRDLIVSCEGQYPSIAQWFSRKVVPGLKNGARTGFVGYVDQVPFASAVVKVGGSAKFCHLRLHREFQDQNLGEIFFCLMAIEVRHCAKSVHFTLPESLWAERQRFFESFGFCRPTNATTQYRLFDDELRLETTFEQLWDAVLQKVGRLGEHFSVGRFNDGRRLLLSIKPKFAGSIFSRTKRVEVRRRFSAKWEGARVTVYSSSPEKALLGEATLTRVVSGNPEKLWDEYGSEMGCSRSDFDSYLTGAEQASLLFLDEVDPFVNALPLSQLSTLTRSSLRAPQSFEVVEPEDSWGQAIALAKFLHTETATTRTLHLP